MATRKSDSRRVRDLPPETRREVERAKANIAVEKVKVSDSRAKIEEHQANISRLKGET